MNEDVFAPSAVRGCRRGFTVAANQRRPHHGAMQDLKAVNYKVKEAMAASGRFLMIVVTICLILNIVST